jgi:hypothetical protein
MAIVSFLLSFPKGARLLQRLPRSHYGLLAEPFLLKLKLIVIVVALVANAFAIAGSLTPPPTLTPPPMLGLPPYTQIHGPPTLPLLNLCDLLHEGCRDRPSS